MAVHLTRKRIRYIAGRGAIEGRTELSIALVDVEGSAERLLRGDSVVGQSR